MTITCLEILYKKRCSNICFIVVDPFQFDPDTWNSGSESGSGSGSDLKSKEIFFLIFFSIENTYNTQNYDLFLKIIWYSYIFGRFFMCYPDPYWINFIVSWSGSVCSERKWIHNTDLFYKKIPSPRKKI